MSAKQRLVFAAVAAAIAVVAVIVLAGGGGDSEQEAAAPTVTPQASATATAEAGATATATPKPTPPPVPTIRVSDGEVVGGVREISVREGERVRFRVRSDVADHVHVHGYDIFRDVSAGATVSFDFKATIPGIVEVELEDAGIELATIRTEQ